MLWIRRAENPADPWSGHMGFPGGQEEPGDPDSRRTAERETREELGLDLGGAEYLGALDEVQARNRAGIQPIQIAPHLFWLTAEPALSVNSAEVDEVHWIPVAHFFDAANRTTLELGSRALPAFRFGERIIWGLSYRILTDLLSRLE
jgi:8-oxo-dGTP pyrophosphatase MutT (NUDIX family)